jgi:hypothetical protein
MTLSIGSELDEEKFSLFNSSDERNFVIKYKENEYQDYSSDENKFYFNIKEIELPLELVNTISLLGL